MTCCGQTQPQKKFTLIDAAKAVVNRDGLADQSIVDKRLEVCSKCPALLALTRQCTKCGCFVDLKSKFSQANCPDFKW